ncbi:helix-turn-helix domain-containing protein [Pelagicoccus albus]|uniref:Helix-turn-helix transcriptional regulator n=1 Tax=Pelagicoccus albus TaxID=415222 RepID=A0A7X1B5B1_9BACT|nr:helix-turn-helix transcriptional regulator [Pelagicoccus albus]MBC2605926.1 helix-turn-helix transcriptional regulator [Pelagicoccus albus]
MPSDDYPHKLVPPSERYPTWQGKAQEGLLYLGWGARNFSDEAIPVHSNPGWTYWVLLEGNVTIQHRNGSRDFTEGEGLRCGPRYPFGFPLQKGNSIKVLNWIWKDKSEGNECSENEAETVAFSKDQIRMLAALHEQSRILTLDTSANGLATLAHIRSLLDLAFQRARDSQNSSDGQNRVLAARQWMLHNLNKTNPSSSLARFLDISPMTLHRLFINEVGESPGAHFRKLKMEQARNLLRLEGHSVKSVAFDMGYRHPQDFSRAYKKRFGACPKKEQTNS